jgi:hypothetical protein
MADREQVRWLAEDIPDRELFEPGAIAYDRLDATKE